MPNVKALLILIPKGLIYAYKNTYKYLCGYKLIGMVSKRVKEICRINGISLKDLAIKLDISSVGLSKIINGNPAYETLQKIATALDVPIQRLFDDASETIHLIIKGELKTFQSLEELKEYIEELCKGFFISK